MAEQRQLILLSAGDPVAGGDVFRRESHVVSIEDLVEAVEDDQIGDLPERHAHPVPPAGVREGEGGVRHVLHPPRHDGLRIPRPDGLGGERDRLHPRGADLVHGDCVGLFGQARIDAGLAARVLSQPRLENVSHDAFVEIDGRGRIGIIVVLFLELRPVHVPENVRTAGADGGAHVRPETGPADRLLDDQRAQIDGSDPLERTAETADGGPRPAYDHNISHLHPSPLSTNNSRRPS